MMRRPRAINPWPYIYAGTLVFWLGVILLISSRHAHAQYVGEWTTDDRGKPEYHPTPEISDWMEDLKRPEHDDDFRGDVVSCCSLGDAYPVRVDIEAIPGHKESVGHACVTDGRAITIKLPNGSTKYRPALPDNTCFKFDGTRVTRALDSAGNPTNSAWAFLSVLEDEGSQTNSIRYIWCVASLLPGS